MTIDELRQMLQSGTYSGVMSIMMHYAKNVTRTSAYWNQVKQELITTMQQIGAPTIFWTLSCADFHWPEFHSSFSPNTESYQLRQNVINNPHILDWLFTERTEKFVNWWLYKTLGAKWHWFRYEFAVQRGSIHCHGLAKLHSDPGLCELTKVALHGYLSSQAKEAMNLHDFSEEQLSAIEDDIRKGKEAETTICEYVDSLMSTNNPCNPHEENWIKPDTHPSKKVYSNIPKSDWDDDYIDLLSTIQRHTQCSSAYCLRYKDGKQQCRFDYPIDKCKKTHLEFEKVHTKDGTSRYKAKIVTARNDTRLNRHQCLQLQGWRANCDINIIIDYHSCVEYLTNMHQNQKNFQLL